MQLFLAGFPLLIAVVTLAVLRWSGLRAGLATALAAAAVAAAAPPFGLGPAALLLAVAGGLDTSLVVLYVLLPGLLLYHLLRAAGGLNALAGFIARLSPDPDLRTLMLGLGLAPFVESVSGFGVGTVLVVPMFAALGAPPWRAAVLGLVSQVAVPWGALSVGTVLSARLTLLPEPDLGARTALLGFPLAAVYGLASLYVHGGAAALRRRWWAALLAGLVLSAGEWGFSLTAGLELGGVLASLLALGALALVGRRGGAAARAEAAAAAVPGPADAPPLPLWRAAVPYAALTALLLATRLTPALRAALQPHPVVWSPGFWVLVSAALATWSLRPGRAGLAGAARRARQQFVPSAVAIVSFLVAAQIMRASGMTAHLGEQVAGLGAGFPWVAPALAGLGGWLTGSNAGSNAMFAVLQQEAATRLGLDALWVLGAQNAAASHATIVSPARVVLAAAAAGLTGREGDLIRSVGWTALLAVGTVTLLLVLALG